MMLVLTAASLCVVASANTAGVGADTAADADKTHGRHLAYVATAVKTYRLYSAIFPDGPLAGLLDDDKQERRPCDPTCMCTCDPTRGATIIKGSSDNPRLDRWVGGCPSGAKTAADCRLNYCDDDYTRRNCDCPTCPKEPAKTCAKDAKCRCNYAGNLCYGDGSSCSEYLCTDVWTKANCKCATKSDDDPCFPSDATVLKADGNRTTIGQLKEGDAILAVARDGAVTSDTVSLLSIAEPHETSSFLTLVTDAGEKLALTREHHLPVGPTCCATLKRAEEVAVGDTIYALDPHGARAVRARTVVEIVDNGLVPVDEPTGLHSPVCTHGGHPIVDGLVTSFDTALKVRAAAAGLPSLLAACKATGTCDALRTTFLSSKRRYVE